MPSSNNRDSKENSDKTRPYKVNKSKKRNVNKKNINRNQGRKPQVKKGNKQQKGKKVSKHPKLMMALKIALIIFLLLCVIGAGIIAGMFFGLFGDEFEITKKELTIGISNSVVVDQNGGVIADLSGDEKRKVITLEDMSEYLPKAYVAIEDERFYKHNGVDLKRTAGAILHTLTGDSSYGGSTITQQLVKNITKDDDRKRISWNNEKSKRMGKSISSRKNDIKRPNS